MRQETFPIQMEDSEIGANLQTYILDTEEGLLIQKRPLILMCPGGGYTHISKREGEPLAMRFLAMGYHVAVLHYSCAPAVYPTALLELAQSMTIVHAHAAEWHVDEERIVVQGCSAGGHLAASLGVFWQEKWITEIIKVEQNLLRPAGLLLCYPVITSGRYAHKGSFEALLDGKVTERMLARVSLEKQVTAQTPPVFLWHTYTDASVPVENSLLFACALRKKKIPLEFHLYPRGRHGLSTADEQAAHADGAGIQKECQSWLPLAQMWLRTTICGEEAN